MSTEPWELQGTTEGITYRFDTPHSDAPSDPVLESMVQYLKSNPNMRLGILVGGRTGEESLNPSLSKDRELAIRAYFIAAGIDANRLVALEQPPQDEIN